MRCSLRIALPALVLVLGVHSAGAIDAGAAAQAVPPQYASQPLSLSTEQEKLIWQRIRDEPMPAPPLSSLPVRPGETISGDIPLQPLPDGVTADVPFLKGYAYTIVQDRLMLVNPSDKTVGRVIDINQRAIR